MKKILRILLCLAILAGSCISCFGADRVSAQIGKTAAYLLSQNPNPGPGDMGGDWVILGLARAGAKVPEYYYETYYKNLVSTLEKCGGVLSSRKYTEYSRVAVTLSALGADPADVGGFDMLAYLADFNAVKWQGVNGPVWALIALDSAGYEIPENKGAEVQATRQMYINYILSTQLEDGGFNLSGKGAADVDITAMVLQALADYQNQAAVKKACDEALVCLQSHQKDNGHFECYGKENCESVAQVIVALCELGLGPDDVRFAKNGKTLVDSLLSFADADGSFLHSIGGTSTQMSTEQAFYALAAVKRFAEGKSSLYSMNDAEKLVTAVETSAFGLAGMHPDVRLMPVTKPGTGFSDISASDAKDAILELAARGIISGMGEGTFKPDETMTRAQFATIVTLSLGLSPEDTKAFDDVKNVWYAPYVGTANKYGIVSGRSAKLFDPESTITRQEAAIMVAKAAKLCGMDIAMNEIATRNVLAQFGDYTKAASWAQPYLAFCYNADILDQSDLDIEPLHKVTRAEIAQMLYNMLEKAKLL